ncbi:MAG: flagellar basal body P-ring formation protein FlgA [Gammaproteobacteria bacterium]|nr:flagellar basal body P-ring formation protein FlgA [Gammaproteobacteria bacterium]
MKRHHNLIVTIISIFLFTIVYANKIFASIEQQSMDSIIDVAINYAREQMPDTIIVESINGALLSDKFKFPKCSLHLEAFTTGSFRANNHFAVGVRCASPQWKIYVPIKADLYTEVIVANNTILKGDVIEVDDLDKKIKPYKGSYLRNISTLKDIVGKIAKRNISTGNMIRPSQLKTNYLVKKKQQVMIIAQTKLFQVQMKGIALNNGHKNDIIKVRNSSSNKIVEAVIIKPGKVRVNF